MRHVTDIIVTAGTMTIIDGVGELRELDRGSELSLVYDDGANQADLIVIQGACVWYRSKSHDVPDASTIRIDRDSGRLTVVASVAS